jgi:DNA phosphorothioation-dependent restriction protein DptG
MPYGIVEDVRRLAGIPSDNDVVTDAEIQDMILSSDDEVSIATGKFDWSSQDEGYKTVEEASNFLAAYSVIVAWDPTPDNLDKAKELRSRGLELIKSLKMGRFTSGNSSVVIGSTTYNTYQLNDSVEPFMSEY